MIKSILIHALVLRDMKEPIVKEVSKDSAIIEKFD